MMKREDIVKVWKSVGEDNSCICCEDGFEPGDCGDPNCDGKPVIWTWEYKDGTGNAQLVGESVPFNPEGELMKDGPSAFLDRAYYTVRVMKVKDLPAEMG